MTRNEIRIEILERVVAMANNCNSYHMSHNAGIIRGLLWSMIGSDPGDLSDLSQLLTVAGIPYTVDGRVVTYATPGDADWPKED